MDQVQYNFIVYGAKLEHLYNMTKKIWYYLIKNNN